MIVPSVAKMPSGKNAGLQKQHRAARIAARDRQEMLEGAPHPHPGVSLGPWEAPTCSISIYLLSSLWLPWGNCDSREGNNGDHRTQKEVQGLS